MGLPALDLFTAAAVSEATPPALTVVRVRSKLCPPLCPHDYADVDARGGALLRVVGPPQFPRWFAEYSVAPATRVCEFCDDTKDGDLVVAILPDNRVAACHPLCRQNAGARKKISMGTHELIHSLPDCAMCGLSYGNHFRPLGSIFDAYCDLDGHGNPIFYKPSAPFASSQWPYEMVVDSPRYATDTEGANR